MLQGKEDRNKETKKQGRKEGKKVIHTFLYKTLAYANRKPYEEILRPSHLGSPQTTAREPTAWNGTWDLDLFEYLAANPVALVYIPLRKIPSCVLRPDIVAVTYSYVLLRTSIGTLNQGRYQLTEQAQPVCTPAGKHHSLTRSHHLLV